MKHSGNGDETCVYRYNPETKKAIISMEVIPFIIKGIAEHAKEADRKAVFSSIKLINTGADASVQLAITQMEIKVNSFQVYDFPK